MSAFLWRRTPSGNPKLRFGSVCPFWSIFSYPQNKEGVKKLSFFTPSLLLIARSAQFNSSLFAPWATLWLNIALDVKHSCITWQLKGSHHIFKWHILPVVLTAPVDFSRLTRKGSCRRPSLKIILLQPLVFLGGTKNSTDWTNWAVNAYA